MPLFLSFGALLLSAALLHLGNGLIQTFLPIRMANEGFSSTAIGIMVTGHAVGFLVGCLKAPAMIQSIGHIRVFVASAALTAITALAFSIAVDTALWTLLRVGTGFCSAAMFTALESWLNAGVPRESRGSLIGAYMIANKLALIAGQLLLILPFTPVSFFMVGSAIYSLCLLPLATTTAAKPIASEASRLGLRHLYAIAPTALAGCLAAGLVNSAVIGLGPVYAADIGLPRDLTAAVISAMQAGSLILQWPLGRLSDRIDRRGAILIAAAGSVAASAALLFGGALPLWLLFLIFAIWGGFALSTYAVSIAHANDLARQDQLVSLSSSLLLVWALGSSIGPLAAAAVMDRFGPDGLFAYSGALYAWLMAFTAWRMSVRHRALAGRRSFVNLPATSPAIARLDPRTDEKAPGVRGHDDW